MEVHGECPGHWSRGESGHETWPRIRDSKGSVLVTWHLDTQIAHNTQVVYNMSFTIKKRTCSNAALRFCPSLGTWGFLLPLEIRGYPWGAGSNREQPFQSNILFNLTLNAFISIGLYSFIFHLISTYWEFTVFWAQREVRVNSEHTRQGLAFTERFRRTFDSMVINT